MAVAARRRQRAMRPGSDPRGAQHASGVQPSGAGRESELEEVPAWNPDPAASGPARSADCDHSQGHHQVPASKLLPGSL